MNKTAMEVSPLTTKASGRTTALLTALCLVSVVLFLGLTPFNTRGEPREAIVAYSMLQDNNWILPVNNGDEIAFKPPVLHWLVALLSTLSGHITEFTARLPSALAATAIVVATFRFFAHRRDESVALLAALLTLTNFEVHRAAMTCRVDMLLSALIVMGLYDLYRWHERGLHGTPWAAWLCLAGAALTKGPVGIALPCAVPAVFLWIRGKGFFRVFFAFFGVAVAACILPALWYVAAYAQGGERFLGLVLEENVYRLMGKMTYASHENPAWYNVVTVVAGYVPYTLLVLLSL